MKFSYYIKKEQKVQSYNDPKICQLHFYLFISNILCVRKNKKKIGENKHVKCNITAVRNIFLKKKNDGKNMFTLLIFTKHTNLT